MTPFTLAVYHGEQCISKHPTSGHLLSALWSPDSKYVAVNNRQGNAGDYVWVFSLIDGKVLKVPLGSASKDEDEATRFADNLVKEIAITIPGMANKPLLRFFSVATSWLKENQLQIKTDVTYRTSGNTAVAFVDTFLVVIS